MRKRDFDMSRLGCVCALVLSVAGCGNKLTGIVWDVDSSGPITGIAHLHGTASLNGGAPATIDLVHATEISIPPSASFAIQLPDNAAGSVTVQLDAQSDDGTVLGSGGGTATILPHKVQTDAHVVLTPTGSGLVFDSTTKDFGTVTVSMTSQPFTFTATNMGMDQTGTPMVTIDGTDADDFTFTTTCNDPVAAAGTCTVDVTFAPSAEGTRTAALHVTATPGGEATAMLTGTGMKSAGATFAIAPPSFLFNDTPETMTGNSTTFTVTNTGGAASPALGNSMIAGGMNTSYTITTDGCFAKVLQPNDTCMVTVQFKPVAAGMQSSTLTVAGAGAMLKGRGQGTWHDEGNMNGGPGPATFFYGAYPVTSDQLVVTTNGGSAYFVTPNMPATFVQKGVSVASQALLQGVWGPGKNDIYLVDTKGEVFHYDTVQNQYLLFNSGLGTGCCTGIWGFSDTNFYTVGGTVAAHYDGTWHTQTVNATGAVALNAVWASSSNNIFAVGDAGLIVHNDGVSGTWTQQISGTTDNLYAIWGSSANDIYVVGANDSAQVPIILHYNGTAWSEQASGKNQGKFVTVWVAPDGEAWIGDYLTPVLHSDGDGVWTDVTPTPAGGEKWQIRGTSDHDVYMFTEDGYIYHYY
jgi:hypothetical protein